MRAPEHGCDGALHRADGQGLVSDLLHKVLFTVSHELNRDHTRNALSSPLTPTLVPGSRVAPTAVPQPLAARHGAARRTPPSFSPPLLRLRCRAVGSVPLRVEPRAPHGLLAARPSSEGPPGSGLGGCAPRSQRPQRVPRASQARPDE